MGLKTLEVILVLALNLIHCAYSEHILSCNVTSPEPCPGDNQICNETSSECVCSKGFVFIGDECESPDSPNTHEPHGATATVVTIFTIAIIVFGLVLVVRKYNLVEYVRQKIYLRRNHDVMYEDVMIGTDDPPLSP